ncbi:MAG: hypothetical protein IJQ81_16025 [Oscillibacter sp.]|nr:hypothetical protein [Oscillibacter sp.]
MNTIRKASRNGINSDAFSLPEMLMVTAIAATLLTVSFVNAADMIRNSRQTAMDRQAEQIFLALSRNLQGLEASGNTALLQRSFDDFTDENRPVWLIQIKKRDLFTPSKYALYQADDNRDDPAFGELKKLLFPADGLSAALSAGLNNGYWLILFTPGMDVEKPAEKDMGTEYYFARPTVYKIFFAKNEDAGKESFEELLRYDGASVTKESVQSVAARYGDQDDGRKRRVDELNGYVGYYGSDSQSSRVLTSTRYDRFRCEIAEIQNAEKLSVRVKCVIPNDAEYTTCPVEFTLKVEGETSGKTAELMEKPLNAANTWFGDNVATFVLDALGDGTGGANQSVRAKENPDNPATWKDFLYDHGLIPGENLKLTLSASCGVHETESNVIETVNSLFADADTAALNGGVLNVAIACGRHLQNLDAGVSGVGRAAATEDSRVSEIHAKQTQDITFVDAHYPDGVTEDYQKWAKTYENKTFLPVTNEKLMSYDGGGHAIYHLTVNYDNTASVPSRMTNYATNAGLFGTFSGNAITNLTLVDPVIQGVNGVTQSAGGLAGTLSMGSGVIIDKCALYMTSGDETGTLISRAKDAGETPETGMSWLTTGAGENQCAGGLIGLATAAKDGKTLKITNSFASAVVKAGLRKDTDAWGAGCHAGGLVGMADGVKVKIDCCYTGGYLYGADTGGFVGGTDGNASVTASNSYAAGFQYSGAASGNCACGLVNGVVDSVKCCYSVSALNDNRTGYINYDIAKWDNQEEVAEKITDSWGPETFSTPWYYDNTDVKAAFGGADSKFASWTDGETVTRPYNLTKQGLRDYAYPRLTVDGVQVYHGDWKPESAWADGQTWEDSGDAIGGDSSGDAIDSDNSDDAIDGNGNDDAIDGNGNDDAIDGDSSGDAIDGDNSGDAIDGDDSGDAIDGDGSGGAIDGNSSGDAIDSDDSGGAIDGDGSGGAIEDNDSGDEIGGNDNGDSPTESAPSVANADEGTIDPDSDEALYGWTPKENPENELPSNWNG